MVSSGAKRTRYVDGSAGWRFFFFSVVAAAIVGLAFRLYFNPNRIQGWVESALLEHKAPADIRFQAAALKLSRGAVPFFAVEIRSVEISLTTECRFEPGLRIDKLWIPISFSSLFTGRVAIGTIDGEGVMVDIDTLKGRCPEPAVAKQNTKKEIVKSGAVEKAAAAIQTSPSSTAKSWWTQEEIAEVRKAVGGLRLSGVEVFFEERTKKVHLGSLAIGYSGGDGIKLESDLIVPPELVFDERLPALRIEVDARPDSATLRVRAGLNEGDLVAEGALKPASGGLLDAEITASLKNVPLSTLAPLATRSGIVNGTFSPRFLWMNCRVEIRGHFQGLLENNPLHLEDCEIRGGGGASVRVAKAVRYPHGGWGQIRLDLNRVDLRRLMETFGWQAAEGIFSEYGQLSGLIEIPESGEGKFEGAVENAVLRFSSHKQLAFQKLNRMKSTIHLKDGKLDGILDGIEFEGGAFDGRVEFALSEGFKRGSAHAAIRTLRLAPGVEELLFGGRLENAHGDATAAFRAGRLTEMKSLIHLQKLEGKSLRFDEATAETEFDPSNEGFKLRLRTPELRLARGSTLVSATRPLFFGHEFRGEWLSVRELLVQARFLKSGGLAWDSLSAALEGGLIQVHSAGRFARDRVLTGWISLDYPLVKKLRWRLAGQLGTPTFTDDSETLAELRRTPVVNDKVLGLPEPSIDDGDTRIDRKTL